MPRPYTKRSPYWTNRKQASQAVAAMSMPPSMANVPGNPLVPQAPAWEVEAAFDDQPHYSAKAACGGGIQTTTYRDGVSPSSILGDRYVNIRSGLMPYTMAEGGYYGVSEAIQLVYQAYYSFALLRNAISLVTDFSVAPLHITTSNTRVKTFITEWFEAIGLNALMQQFFLEYYRSGNVFLYTFNGRIEEDSLKDLRQTFARAGEVLAAERSPKVPIRYTILNPMQIYLQMGPNEPYGYVRMMSTYEIQRLRNPQTVEDEQVLKSFSPEVQQLIKRTGSSPYLYVPLDPKRLYYVFYRKMDYEPLAVPMAFPVLNDIEYKLELRRMDMALASTIERVILLVTTGRQADQWNQVPPKSNLQNLQDIFRNQTIGRVLVADYTTKAEWVIPDLKELLGPGKYQQVDKDIKEGLQYMFFGEEKFANASIKVKIFIESLKEGRRAFLEGFLIPEVRKVCKAMGFRHVPTLEFEEIKMQDEALMARLYVQMAQLGLLTPEELNEALTSGMLPTAEESLTHQEAYKKARDKDLYQPIAPKKEEAGTGSGSSVGKGRPGGTGGTPAGRKVSSPIGTRNVKAHWEEAAATEDASTDVLREKGYRFGMTRIAENLVCMNGLKAAVEKAYVKRFKVKGGAEALSPEEKTVAATIAQSIVFNEDGGPDGTGWLKQVKAYVENPKDLPETVAKELVDIRATFHTAEDPVDSWMAGVLLRSKVSSTP